MPQLKRSILGDKMQFYHCFYTDLPDQFVEANADRLIKWMDGWKDKNRYYARQQIIDRMDIRVIGAATDRWPTLTSASQRLTDLWMKTKGRNYNGGYWGTLAEDQRDPNRVTSVSRGDDPDDSPWGIGPGTLYTWPLRAGKAARSGIKPVNVRQLITAIDQPKPKPSLKRDSVIAGEIVGYRCWRVEGGFLKSVYQDDVWVPGQIIEGRGLEDWDQRGVHAWKDPGSKEYHEYIRAYLNLSSDPFLAFHYYGTKRELRPAMATGTIFMWGDVVEHERGYRAEYARVRSLDWLYPDQSMMGRESDILDVLRRRYALTQGE